MSFLFAFRGDARREGFPSLQKVTSVRYRPKKLVIDMSPILSASGSYPRTVLQAAPCSLVCFGIHGSSCHDPLASADFPALSYFFEVMPVQP